MILGFLVSLGLLGSSAFVLSLIQKYKLKKIDAKYDYKEITDNIDYEIARNFYLELGNIEIQDPDLRFFYLEELQKYNIVYFGKERYYNSNSIAIGADAICTTSEDSVVIDADSYVINEYTYTKTEGTMTLQDKKDMLIARKGNWEPLFNTEDTAYSWY